MKIFLPLTTAVLACAIALSGCGKSKADEQAAIEQFKKDTDGIGQWMSERQKSAFANPMAGVAMMKELVGKLRSMKTEDLPDDLKQAYGDFLTQLGKMEAVVGELGAELGGDTAAIMKNVANPQKLRDVATRMKAINAEMQPVAARLKDVATKYGVAKIAELGPK
jgi:hypothetical protein